MTKQEKKLSTFNVLQNSGILRDQTTLSLNLNGDDTGDKMNALRQKTSPIYGALFIPIIMIVTFANVDFVINWKGVKIASTEIELQIIFNALMMITISVAYHHYDYLLIMGRNEANSGRYLIFQYFLFGSVYNSIKYGLEMLQADAIALIRLPTEVNGAIAANFSFFSIQFLIWLHHPKPERSDPIFLKRFFWFILSRITNVVFTQVYYQSNQLYDKFDNDTWPQWLQPILVLLLLGMRDAMIRIQMKMVEKASGENSMSAKFAVNSSVGCVHALFLMLIVGSKATKETAILYGAIDTVLLLSLFRKTIKSVGEEENEEESEKEAIIQKVITRETLEILLPICFFSIKLLAFYGPNKETLPLVMNKTQSDLLITQGKIFLFMIFDMVRIVSLAIILKKKYGISLFQSYTTLIRNYWKVIATYATLYIFIVSIFTLHYFIDSYKVVFFIRYSFNHKIS